MQRNPAPLLESHVEGLELRARGKVRDIYAIGDDYLLIVATDRLSAFDVILPDPIPGKGAVLTALTEFWLDRTSDLVANHCAELSLDDVVPRDADRAALVGRSMIVRRLEPLPLEAIVRGYLIGSGWREYQTTGAVCGIKLAHGLRQAERLPEAIFTPSTKAEVGEHDENVSFAAVADRIGRESAERVRDLALAIYSRAADYAATRGIIIADTKLEFGRDPNGEIVLIDEVLTPDSSRFWPADEYTAGCSPPSFDKQFVRDYLDTLDWDKCAPGPHLPQQIIAKTAAKYREAHDRLISE